MLGYFFGAKVRTLNKTELLIVITPRVIGTPLDAARVTDEMMRSNPEAAGTMRYSPRPPSTRPPTVTPPAPAQVPAP